VPKNKKKRKMPFSHLIKKEFREQEEEFVGFG
jgi:hypothetical protein